MATNHLRHAPSAAAPRPTLTKKLFFRPAVGLLAVLMAGVAPSAFAVPPKVTKAVPDHGDTDVDPALTQIVIEFNQDMSHDGFSVCGGGPTFPEVVDKPKWKGPRVFVINVRLQPEHDYEFSINCPAAANFRSAAGESAAIYPISFRTGSSTTKAAKRLTSKENVAAMDECRRLIDEAYSYRNLRKVNWNKQFRRYATKLKKARTPAEFARTAAKVLAPAKDVHMWLQVERTSFPTFQRRYKPNYNLSLLPQIVPQWNDHNSVVSTGRFDDGPTYILIKSWGSNNPTDMEPAFAALSAASPDKGVIVDVRPNAGGAEPLALEFAGCFVREPATYSQSAFRTKRKKSGFAKPAQRVVEPNKARPAFKGPVVVLMGKGVMSSCESFVLMMRHGAKAPLIGDTTLGSSGNPKPHELGNGVTLILPSWKDMQPDGTVIEGKGVDPDIRVKPTKADFKTSDPVIEAAIKELKKRAGSR